MPCLKMSGMPPTSGSRKRRQRSLPPVECLSDIGGVITHAALGTSGGGFDAEWRENVVLTVDGEMMSRAEVFDDEDVDAAIATFEQLSQPAPRLENTASQVAERLLERF